jgi:hypothetical protein
MHDTGRETLRRLALVFVIAEVMSIDTKTARGADSARPTPKPGTSPAGNQIPNTVISAPVPRPFPTTSEEFWRAVVTLLSLRKDEYKYGDSPMSANPVASANLTDANTAAPEEQVAAAGTIDTALQAVLATWTGTIGDYYQPVLHRDL